MKTYSPKGADIRPIWHVLDAEGQVLGRLASHLAQLLKGKFDPRYAPHLNMGAMVIVVNASKIAVSGKKLQQKRYYRHSGYPGGLKSTSLTDLLDVRPSQAIEHAVKGMLPHNVLGRAMLRNLRVYDGPEHPHQSQIKGQEKVKPPAEEAKLDQMGMMEEKSG